MGLRKNTACGKMEKKWNNKLWCKVLIAVMFLVSIALTACGRSSSVPDTPTGSPSDLQGSDFLYLYAEIAEDCSVAQELWNHINVYEDETHVELWDDHRNLLISIKKAYEENGYVYYVGADIYSKLLKEKSGDENYLIGSIIGTLEQGEGGTYSAGVKSTVRINKRDGSKCYLWKEIVNDLERYFYPVPEEEDHEGAGEFFLGTRTLSVFEPSMRCVFYKKVTREQVRKGSPSINVTVETLGENASLTTTTSTALYTDLEYYPKLE